MVVRPKLISLDTATWGNLARDKDRNAAAQELIKRLSVGDVIPFLSWHHVAELIHHGSQKVFNQRVALFRSLPFIAFLKQSQEKAYIGNIIDLRNAEIFEAFRDPAADHATIIERASGRITNGFASGAVLCRDNEEWWELYRQNFANDSQRRAAEISALMHFPTTDLSEKVFARDQKLRPLNEAQAQFKKMAQILALRLKKDVKKALPNPESVAQEFMREAYEDGLVMYKDKTIGIDALLKVYGVDRERLPKNPTVADVGDEAVFIKQLSINESQFRLPNGALQQVIRKEMLPSWVVWSGLSRALLKLPKAESGNLNDKSIVPFGLYVDSLQVDKRIRDAIRRVARSSKLFATLQSKLFEGTDYKRLCEEIDDLANH
jgi:hypothetical protein